MQKIILVFLTLATVGAAVKMRQQRIAEATEVERQAQQFYSELFERKVGGTSK